MNRDADGGRQDVARARTHMTRRMVVRGAVVALGVGAALGGVLFGAGPAASDEPPAAARHGLAVSRAEVPELRSGTSRTFALSDGSFEQELSRAPINFRDQAGRWTPIDSTLERRFDGSLENRANSFEVRIPVAADDPVEVEVGGRTLAFELVGGRPQARSVAEDAEATFVDALPGVDAVYEAQSASLKETLFLEDAAAAADLRFDVEAPGLSARVAESGAVEFRDAAGRFRFGFAAPWMSDAGGALSRAVHYELEQRPGGPRVSIHVDAAWLADPARRFPVAVDPTVYYDAYGVCQLIDGTAANTTDCGSAPVWVGRFGGRKHRAAIALPTPDLPYGAVVLGAQTTFWFEQQSEEECSTLDLYGLTREFNEGATWNKADPRTSWTTPGGDLKPVRETRRELQPEWTGYWSALAMHRLVRGWVDETEPNNGVLVKAADESIDHIDILSDIHTTVRYRPRLGLDETAYTYDQRELSDGSVVSVNLGNGNLVVAADDFGLDGFDDQLTVDRSYNGMDDVAEQGVFGVGWRGDLGTVSLDRNWIDGSYAFNGATGLDGLFVKRADGTFEPPEGWNATLTEHPATNTVTVLFEDTGEQWDFEWASGDRWRLVRRAYPSEAGAQAVYDPRTGKLASLRDPEGNVATFTWDGPLMETVRDQFDDERLYDYDRAGRLTRYTSATGDVTTYAYDGSGRLAAITVPDRSGLTFTYWPQGALRSLTPIGTDSRPGATTTYDGGATYTTIDTPGQKRATRHFDRTLLNTQTEIGPTPPTLTLSGALYDARGTTLPEGTTSLGYSASAPEGIAKVEVVVSSEDDTSVDQDCSGTCGSSLSGSWELETGEYGPGLHVIRVVVTDAGGNRREQAFKVTVPPPSWSSDGTMPEDAAVDPHADDVVDTSRCARAYGVDASLFCSPENNPDPTQVEEESLSALAAPGLVLIPWHPVAYGIAQDFHNNPRTDPTGASDWLQNRYAYALRTRHYRRIVPYNIMQTTDGAPYSGDPTRLRYRAVYDDFREQYDLIIAGSVDGAGRTLREPADLIVSFERAHCNERIERCGDPNSPNDVDNVDSPDNRFPSKADYTRNIRDFLSEFPEVTTFSAWNEPNFRRSPLRVPLTQADMRAGERVPAEEIALARKNGGPARAAKYTYWAAQECAKWNTRSRVHCTVLAGEIAQSRAISSTARSQRYLNQYVKRLKVEFGTRRLPRIWAFHPYTDVQNDRRDPAKLTGTDLLIRDIPRGSQVWFTEVGSRVDTGSMPEGRRRNTLATQRAEVEFLYGNLVQSRSAIKRLYYYALCAPLVEETRFDERFDTGLLGGVDFTDYPYGTCRERDPAAQPNYVVKRPAFDVVLGYMTGALR